MVYDAKTNQEDYGEERNERWDFVLRRGGFEVCGRDVGSFFTEYFGCKNVFLEWNMMEGCIGRG